MENCIFCKVLRGELPSEKVYEDEDTVAILDIVAPVNPGHTLVIPKMHVEDIFNVTPELWGKIMQTVKRVAPGVRDGMQVNDVNIIMNNGKHSGQRIFHIHIHIIPRFEGDGHGTWTGTPYEPGQAREVAEKIKNAL